MTRCKNDRIFDGIARGVACETDEAKIEEYFETHQINFYKTSSIIDFDNTTHPMQSRMKYESIGPISSNFYKLIE